jgi:hypothetical protein
VSGTATFLFCCTSPFKHLRPQEAERINLLHFLSVQHKTPHLLRETCPVFTRRPRTHSARGMGFDFPSSRGTNTASIENDVTEDPGGEIGGRK